MNGDNHPVGSPSGESGRANIDYAELRQKAEAATKGEWFAGSWGGQCHKMHKHLGERGDDPCVYEPVRYDDGCIAASDPNGPVVSSSYDGAEISAENAAYIVAAQPSTVLALLDRIEELKGAVAPFAEAQMAVDRSGHPDTAGFIGAGLTLGDLRRARKALSGEKKP